MIQDMKEAAAISPLAGEPAPSSMLVDLARLEREYYERTPDMDDPTQVVSFGTSGHRGSPFRGSFTEAHIAAITQAICDYRRGQRIDPLVEDGPQPAAEAGQAGAQDQVAQHAGLLSAVI